MRTSSPTKMPLLLSSRPLRWVGYCCQSTQRHDDPTDQHQHQCGGQTDLTRRDVIIRRPPPEAQSALGWDSTLRAAPLRRVESARDFGVGSGFDSIPGGTPQAVLAEDRPGGGAGSGSR